MLTESKFPHISKENYTDKGEAIYGGSVGMNRFYDLLVKNSTSPHPIEFGIVAINALTLIRNNYSDSYNDLQKKSQTDINTLVTYLSIFLRNTKKDNRKVSIVLLYPDYKKLPDTLRRPMSPQLTRIMTHYLKDIKSVKSGLDKYFENDVLKVYAFKLGDKKRYPHREFRDHLFGEIDNERRGTVEINYRLNDPIHLISHIALDWHLSEALRNVNLIESYTGEIIDSLHFGSKLIRKKDIKIPFNSVIHQTFGDDTFIKPLAVRNNRKVLLDSTGRWSMMTQSKITGLISDTLDVPITTLTKYNFS